MKTNEMARLHTMFEPLTFFMEPFDIPNLQERMPKRFARLY